MEGNIECGAGGLMNRSLTVRVIDGSTGVVFDSADVRLYPIGTPGERCAVNNQDGDYSFDDLPDGEYSLAVYSSRHVSLYEHVTMIPGLAKAMIVQISPAGFISGQILDERGEPHERCWFTLIREGDRFNQRDRGFEGTWTTAGGNEKYGWSLSTQLARHLADARCRETCQRSLTTVSARNFTPVLSDCSDGNHRASAQGCAKPSWAWEKLTDRC